MQHRYAPAAAADDRLGAVLAVAALVIVLVALAAPALGG